MRKSVSIVAVALCVGAHLFATRHAVDEDGCWTSALSDRGVLVATLEGCDDAVAWAWFSERLAPRARRMFTRETRRVLRARVPIPARYRPGTRRGGR